MKANTTKMIHIYKWLLVVSLSPIGWAMSQVSYTNSIHQTYKVTGNCELTINNKYGKVHVMPWEKDSVSIAINVEMRAKNPNKLEKIKSSVDFDLDQSGSYITVVTNIQGSKEILSGLTEILSNDDKIQIDYTVHAPEKSTLIVSNKYGNIYLGKMTGRLSIDLGHGDLKAGDIPRASKIDVRFGDVRVASLPQSKISLMYASLQAKSAGVIYLNSKYSTITIPMVQKINADSKKDKFFLREITTLKGDFSFSDIHVTKLMEDMNATLKYSNVDVEEVQSAFQNIFIDSKYTDISLTFQEGAYYQFDLEGRKVNFTYPKNLGKLETRDISSEKKDFYLVQGKIGKAKSSISKVKIVAETGDLQITY